MLATIDIKRAGIIRATALTPMEAVSKSTNWKNGFTQILHRKDSFGKKVSKKALQKPIPTFKTLYLP